jgi:hypothetical protein
MSYDLQIGNIYDFQFLAPALLGTGLTNAKVLGLLDYSSAASIQDVVPVHASIYSLLPAGTPVKAQDLIYVKVKTSLGLIRVIAMNWIASQPTLVVKTTVTVVVSNINMSQLAALRQALIQNGFTSIVISTSA